MLKKKLIASVMLSGLVLAGTTSMFMNKEVQAENHVINMTRPMNEKETVERFDIKDLFSINGHATQLNQNTVRLTPNSTYRAGSITGIKSLDMRGDFVLDIDVNLGADRSGADGIAVAFHQSGIGTVGRYGGGLGILGLRKGVGFEVDTFADAPEDRDPSFGHTNISDAHAGFVFTNRNSSYLTAATPMQSISGPLNQFQKLIIKWDSTANKFTASYEGKTWELTNPPINKNELYYFTIAAATGARRNEHTVRVNSFDAIFQAPELVANDIEINKFELFDPFDSRIGLKATDKIDGDLTDKITVVENNVDTSTPGDYQVTYQVTNSVGETTRKTINVKVVIKETWPNGSVENWKMFSGEDIHLVKDPELALVGDYVFHADQHASIYKHYTGAQALVAGKTYRATVYFKPELDSDLRSHHVKLSLKANPSSNDSRDIFNTTLDRATLGVKDYRYVTQTFTVGEDETEPLIIIENYRAGYIGSIDIVPQ
ncbi:MULTISPECIES: immunoglobulin-like domain-containing protein [unclassified Enterococcus]|uniref:lectin-like domain-containing protein n=1 Tax=unclassified Enterococcus TaxID=2608891 RepID=UPI0013EB2879|nr:MULTISPECIES: immunoglobulin-like domain-containing protein [unclassified Enterococcus]